MTDPKIKYYRKHVPLFELLDKVKLWPSRGGTLHGIKSVEKRGKYAMITTHCGVSFTVYDSKNSRSARWLRNKWAREACGACAVPQWKLEKYNATRFSRYFGSDLSRGGNQERPVL